MTVPERCAAAATSGRHAISSALPEPRHQPPEWKDTAHAPVGSEGVNRRPATSGTSYTSMPSAQTTPGMEWSRPEPSMSIAACVMRSGRRAM